MGVATSSAAAVAVAANMVMVMLAVNEALAALTIWACDELIYVQCGTDELADFLRSLTRGRRDRESRHVFLLSLSSNDARGDPTRSDRDRTGDRLCEDIHIFHCY